MSDTKLCPFCAEEIKSAAIKCKHCGEMLAERPAAPVPCAPPAVEGEVPIASAEADLEQPEAPVEKASRAVKRPPGLVVEKQSSARPALALVPPGKSPSDINPVGLLMAGIAIFGIVMWGIYLSNNPRLVAKEAAAPPKTDVQLLYQQGNNTVFEVTTPDGKKATVHVNPEGEAR